MPRAREARLSYLLLCLEAAVHRGEWGAVIYASESLPQCFRSLREKNTHLQRPHYTPPCLLGHKIEIHSACPVTVSSSPLSSLRNCISNNLNLCAGRPVSGECQGEMLDYRRMLMEDFSLSPEIVLHCRTEIEAHCSGLHRKGRTLHCLMRIGRGDRSITIDSVCQSAVRP